MPKKKGISSSIQDMIKTVYGRTYSSQIADKQVLDNLSQKMDASINNIINANMDRNGVNISRLYSRLNRNKIDGDDLVKSLDETFGDQNALDGIMSIYMDNKYIKDLDEEIDTICRYMPKIEDALEVKKDSILSSDVFSKEFMSINNLSNSGSDKGFDEKIRNLMNEYKLSDMLETTIEKTLKYGETFLYVVPYKKAIGQLLQAKNKTHGTPVIKVNESGMTINGVLEKPNKLIKSFDEISLSVSMEEGIITSIVESAVNLDIKADGQSILRDIRDDQLEYDSDASDGLVDESKLSISGCVVRRLARANVIPLYIDEVCFGYYYIETTNSNLLDEVNNMNDPFAKIKAANGNFNDSQMIKDELLRNISKNISLQIDHKFVDSNPELKKEIYMILKHNFITDNESEQAINGDVRITFIPPEDIIHFTYNRDDVDHRGISDLQFSLIPAKLYSCLYIANTVGVLTRSHDKRAYFVRQGVDTNISKLLLNTINQIKKSNFGIREINNMNNMLNITGRYNDYVIPVGPSGERPIDFEIIPGQDIDTKPELMESLETMAINPIGVPLELIDMSRSIDYSRQLTTANGKFARHILKRQLATQQMFSDLISRIYNYHYGTSDVLECLLAPPSHLTVTNITELLRSTQETVDVYIDLEVSDDERSEPWVPIFKKNLMKHYISSFVNWDNIRALKERAKIEAMESKVGKDDDSY